jgi:uncharacterized membrane protein HdeD (DUF308 family)
MKKETKRKIFSSIVAVFGAATWIYIGIMLIVASETVIKNFYFVSLIIVVAYTIIRLINVFVNKERKEYFRSILRAIINISFGIFLYYHIDLYAKGIVLLYILYLLVLAITELINTYIYHSNHIHGIIKPIANALLTIVITIILIFNQDNVQIASLIFGIYLIIYGSFELLNMIVNLLPQEWQEKIQIALPSVIAMVIPKLLIKKIDNDMVNNKFEKTKYQKKPGHANLFVIIHLAESGTAAYGHIEIAIGNKTYSFGNYNNHASTLFGAMGDGVIAVCDRQKYMRQQVILNKRYLFEFGIHVTPLEMLKIKSKINSMFKDTVPWLSDIERKANGDLSIKSYDDASSNMHRYADAKFYRITKGPHQKFFLFQSNCTMLPETVLDIIGMHMHSMNGILAPGNYFDYLNAEYNRDNSKVVSKRIYTKEDFI